MIAALVLGCGNAGNGGAISKDASLSSVAVSEGVANRAFDPAVYEYSFVLGDDVAGVTISAAAAQSGSRLAIAGVVTGSNEGAVHKNLAPGENLVDIAVTAPDGRTTQTYSLLIVRESPNQGCTFSGAGVECTCDVLYVFDPDTGGCIQLPSL